MLDGEALAEVIVRLEKQYAKAGFNSYRKDGSTCDFLTRFLPSLDPFADVFLVTFASLADSPTDSAILKKLIRDWGPISQRRACLGWRLDSIDFGGQVDRKATFSAGLGRHGFHCGVYGAQDEAVGYGDRQVRARFLEEIVATMGLCEQIHVRWEGDDFWMESSLPWKLNFPVAELRGKNPHSVEIAGFSNIEEAIAFGERLAERYAGEVPAPTFVGAFAKGEYEQIRPSLEDQAGPWKGLVLGSLRRESKDALSGKFSAETPAGPIPAFDWHTTDTEEEVFGAITVQEAGGCLELSVEHRAECDLLAQTAFLSDVKFEVV